jgi:SAM-dependent methyltransferase
MTENCYLAKDSPDAFERERLSLLTQIADPITTRRLIDLGVGPGWRCLEVGAGEGSVARWLAGRVGPEGCVVATDLNPRFLVGQELPNLEVRRHNILEDDLEASHYDLVHCRTVLMHLPEPSRALRRLVDAVRPGGWLLIEEADGAASFGAADSGHPRAAGFDRRTRTLWTGLKAAGTMDLDFGRRLPAIFDRLGVLDVGNQGVTFTGRGGDPMARFLQMTDELLRERFVTAGVLTAADFDELRRAYGDPSFWFVGFTLFGAWGRRPELAQAVSRSSCQAKENTMMTSELRYLLKTNSDHEVCSDQASLRDLFADLRALADDLDLDFGEAYREAEIVRDLSCFDPVI